MNPKTINEIVAGTFTGNVNESIIQASNSGHIEVVKLLLSAGADPTTNSNYAIVRAANNGHVEIVKLLLADPRVDPAAGDNMAIGYSSENGSTDVVKLLLKDPRVDPDTHDNYAIIFAVKNGHTKVVKRLLNALKHRFNIAKYTEILAEAREIPNDIKELLINHIISYQWIVKIFLNQHLTVDLLNQINYFIVAS